MGTPWECRKIKISLYREYTEAALDALKELGLGGLHLENGRSLQLGPGTALTRLFGREAPLSEEPISVLSFMVEPDVERTLLDWLASRLHLGQPGRGSVVSKPATLVSAYEAWVPSRLSVPVSPAKVHSEKLTGITCIMQKGEINPVARLGLSTGSGIPLITYGTGTGLRNRLGAWRIMIPAEKEISSLVVDAHEAPAVMDLMIDAGRLDLPGRGFIYSYPVAAGRLDTRFQTGTVSNAASTEQMISAIDELKGTTDWRRKAPSEAQGTSNKRKYLTELVDLVVVCNEGFGEHFTKVAMEAGAGGATYRNLKYVALGTPAQGVSPAREISEMTVGKGQLAAICEALVKAGLHDAEASGELHQNAVIQACTYLGK